LEARGGFGGEGGKRYRKMGVVEAGATHGWGGGVRVRK
jgi:hypothetical protein